MRSIRRPLSWILSVWLVFQLAGIMAPLVLSAAGYRALDALCECPGTDIPGATCPMHHNPVETRDDAGRCRLQSARVVIDGALLPLAGGVGVLLPAVLLEIGAAETLVAPTRSSVVSRAALPDSPPPLA